MKKLLLCLIFFLSSFAADAADVPAAAAAPAPAEASSAPADDVIPDKILKQIAVLISSQIRPCWKIPATTNSTPLQAIIQIDAGGNMTFVDFASPVPPEQQQVADSVKDAIADPKCNPLKKLPPANLYDTWQNLTLLFTPKN